MSNTISFIFLCPAEVRGRCRPGRLLPNTPLLCFHTFNYETHHRDVCSGDLHVFVKHVPPSKSPGEVNVSALAAAVRASVEPLWEETPPADGFQIKKSVWSMRVAPRTCRETEPEASADDTSAPVVAAGILSAILSRLNLGLGCCIRGFSCRPATVQKQTGFLLIVGLRACLFSG